MKIGLAALAALCPAHLEAQMAEPGSVVVTAQKTREALLSVPTSIAVIEGGSLEVRGLHRLEDVARVVPNLNVSPGGLLGANQISIRGVSSLTGASTVGLYLDETPFQIRPLGFSGSAAPYFFDLDRIEVLRGPQGTLYGASSIGGTVRFITRQPDFGAPSGRGLVETGVTEGGGLGYQIGLAVGGPIANDRIAARLSANFRRDAGVVDRLDRQTGEVRQPNVDVIENAGVRGIVTARFGGWLTITPSLFYQFTKREDLPLSQNDLPPFRQSFINRQPGNDRFLLPSITLDASLGDTTLTSVSSYFRRRDHQVSDYSPVFGELVLGGQIPGVAPPGGTLNVTRTGQRSVLHEVRLSGGAESGEFRWLAGLYYNQARILLEQNVVEPGLANLVADSFGTTIEAFFGVPLLPGGVSYRGNERISETEIAAFGSASWKPIEKLEATIGLRLARSKLNIEVISDGPYAGGLTSTGPRGKNETPILPRLALSYRAARQAIVYASVSKGYRSGGANLPVPVNPCKADLESFGMSEAPTSYGSDAAWNYEIGLKSSSRFLNLSGAVFQIDWSRVQQLIMLPNCGFSFIANLGAARSRGFELEAELRPSRQVRLSLGLGHVNARLRNSVLANSDVATSAPTVIVERGDRLLFTPRWSANVAAEYTGKNFGNIAPYVRAEHQYVGRYKRTPGPPAIGYKPLVFSGDSYSNASLRIGLRGPKWNASLFVDNLLNDRSVLYSSSDLVPATGSPLRQTRLRPRTFGFNLAMGFRQ